MRFTDREHLILQVICMNLCNAVMLRYFLVFRYLLIPGLHVYLRFRHSLPHLATLNYLYNMSVLTSLLGPPDPCSHGPGMPFIMSFASLALKSQPAFSQLLRQLWYYLLSEPPLSTPRMR